MRFIFTFIFIAALCGSEVQINEIVSSNQNTFFDEDGDTPDWIELYNSSSNDISILNWGLTDDSSELFKWRFPNTVINAGDYLLIMASNKNRTDLIAQWETIIDWGDQWHYFVGNQAPPSQWNQVGFNTSGWGTGASGFGYGDNDDNTIINQTISIFIVKTFSISDVDHVKKIAFHIDYDDGFVAYLNGQEFARSNIIGDPPNYNQGTETWREAQMFTGGEPELHWIDSSDVWVNEGVNTLAIQVHNFNNSSSDMSCIPFLTVGRDLAINEAQGVAEELNLPGSMLHTNFKISSSGETIVLTKDTQDIADSLYTGILATDVSIGRVEQGDDIGFFLNPTPNEANGSQSVMGVLNELTIAQETGFYNEDFIYVGVYTDENDVNIYYTLDGSEPTNQSNLYSGPIFIQENKVLRAIGIKSGWLSSPIITRTFIFDSDSQGFPAIFLSTAPDNFFDYNTGIYVMGPNASADYPHFGANFWEDWEKPIYLEVLEEDGVYFSSPAGVKIFGGWSRGQAQKSFSIFARGEYGSPQFNYPLFPNLDIDIYQSFVLRNSGNDWNFTMLRDGFATGIFEDIDLDIQAYKPVLVYLNGEFWGLYNLREKVNEHFIASHHEVDPDEIDLIEVQQASEGNIDNYNQLINYIENSDMTSPEVYDSLSKWIDIDNHIDYNVAQIFIDNRDWPGNNIKYWRPHAQQGLWRWILYDTDFGFGINWMGLGYNFNTLAFATEENGPNWPNPPWSTFLLRKMLENPTYKNRFINIFSDRLNTIFKSNNLTNRLDSLSNKIETIISIHQERWEFSAQNWSDNIQIIENFSINRSFYMRQFIADYFDLSNTIFTEFNISSQAGPHGGRIKINTIIPESYPWGGYYYLNVPIEVTAIADTGYIFSGWTQFPDSSQSMKINITSGFTLTATFESYSLGDSSRLVINEINYNSADNYDTKDWIELYNNGVDSVDITGWYITDENVDNRYTFPETSVLHAGEYLVLAQDTVAFLNNFVSPSYFYGPFDFGFSGGGESIFLYDVSGVIVDKIEYNDSFPWPTEADGSGSTLELIHPDLNNELPESWAASDGYGSPGEQNSVFDLLGNQKTNEMPNTFNLFSAYPNPFNSSVSIKFRMPNKELVDIIIFNILGEMVRILAEKEYKFGDNIIRWDGKDNQGRDLSTGVYFCNFKSKNYQKSMKLLLVK